MVLLSRDNFLMLQVLFVLKSIIFGINLIKGIIKS